MPIETGQQYIDSLRDGRRLFIDGKVVSDGPTYPSLLAWDMTGITRQCEQLVHELLKG